MQARLALTILSITLMLTGCSNTINRAQFHVMPVTGEGVSAGLTDADRGAAVAIITQTAARLHLRDLTEISRIPNCLAMFQSAHTDYPIKLVAWENNGNIVVDMLHKPSTLGETIPFREAREDLLHSLRTRFGDRVQVAKIPQVIPARP